MKRPFGITLIIIGCTISLIFNFQYTLFLYNNQKWPTFILNLFSINFLFLIITFILKRKNISKFLIMAYMIIGISISMVNFFLKKHNPLEFAGIAFFIVLSILMYLYLFKNNNTIEYFKILK